MINNLVTRTISGFLFVAILICGIIFNSYVFGIVFSILTGLSVYEFHRITSSDKMQSSAVSGVAGGVLLFIVTFLHCSKLTTFPVFVCYGFYVILILLAELFRNKKEPLFNWAQFLTGQIMVALPFALLNYILFINSWQPTILLAVFVTIWVNDTGAYLSGITLGRHKLFERISPKKTWEGFIGGAIAALVSGFIFSYYNTNLNLTEWLIFSEIIVIFGTLGDLTESLLKRTLHIKDSGTIIPGHGGMLDRFDSMLMATPVILIYLIVLMSI